MASPPSKLWKLVLGSLVMLGSVYFWGSRRFEDGLNKGVEDGFNRGILFDLRDVETHLKICLQVYAFPTRMDGPRAQHLEEAISCLRDHLQLERESTLRVLAGE